MPGDSLTHWIYTIITGLIKAQVEYCHFSCILLFHSGATDTFEFSSKHVGEIAGICIGHITKDGRKVKNETFWHVMVVVVTEMELGNK